MDGLWTEACGQQKQSKRPQQQPAHPQYANYWAPHTRKRHIPPHPAQPQHTNHWAPRSQKRHQQEHRPQRLTESSDPTQHAKGRMGDCPGPRKETTTRRNVTRGDPPPSAQAKPCPYPPPEAAMDCGPKHHPSRACAHQSTPPPRCRRWFAHREHQKACAGCLLQCGGHATGGGGGLSIFSGSGRV